MNAVDKFRLSLAGVFALVFALLILNDYASNKATYDELASLAEAEKYGASNTREIQNLLDSMDLHCSPDTYRKAYKYFLRFFRGCSQAG